MPFALSVNAGADTGGQSIRMKWAFDRHAPDWEFRSMNQQTNYIAYPQDLPYRTKLAGEMWESADVVHLHNNFRTAALLERRHRAKRPMVVHYHGTAFRTDPLSHAREQRARGALAIVSTLDLYLLAPDDTEWLPAPYDIDWLASLRQKRDDDRIRIVSAPTNRTVKSTEAFLVAVKRLQDEGYPVELDLIERTTWQKCLERKASADIFFDQVILGYGCNALEAWGMGIPVVCGASDATLDEMERRFGRLPFYHATEGTIYDALRELVESPELRAKYGVIGHQYVRNYHDERKVVAQLIDVYQRAIGAPLTVAA